jgi:transcriptional regulator with XRE-family HTH domain
MTWSKEKVKALRLRLGWSQADLARRLNIEVLNVIKIENGDCETASHMNGYFTLLQNHADLIAEETMIVPLAEDVMKKNDLDQIDQDEFKRTIFS